MYAFRSNTERVPVFQSARNLVLIGVPAEFGRNVPPRSRTWRVARLLYTMSGTRKSYASCESPSYHDTRAMPEDRPKARFCALAVAVGAEDVLGQCLMQLDLAIEPFCSSLEPSGHRGTHCRGAVDALGSSVRWLVIPVD